jgi:restriction system protein
MARKSMLEEMIEDSFKYPVIGVLISVVAAIMGFYFSHKSAPPGNAAVVSGVLNVFFSKAMYWFSGIILFFSALGYTVQVINRKRKHAFFDQKDTLAELKALPWKEFEHFVGTFFEKMGYQVEVTGGLKDGGIDIIISKDNKLHFVQCKKYLEKKVTLSMVRDFYGAMAAKRNREKGFFVTTGTATLDAQKFAEENSIELIDGPRLLEYIQMSKHNVVQKTASHSSTAGQTKTKICPDCGSPMTVRVAKKGAHVNKPFWGCTNYPKCRAIVSYEG